MCFLFQIRVQASDQSIPEKISEAVVQVIVRRDLYMPEFQGSYDRSMPLNFAVNQQKVMTVKAADRDLVVSIHSQPLQIVLVSTTTCEYPQSTTADRSDRGNEKHDTD